MTSIPKFYSLLILFLLFLAPTVLGRKSRSKLREPCKRMVLYCHNVMFHGHNVANATGALVVNPTKLGDFVFGSFTVIDDPMTTDQNLLSPPVARAQGFYLYDMKSTYSIWMGYTLIFNSSEYKGTLNVVGQNILTQEYRDLSIVGGTGDFFLARGIVTLKLDELQANDYFRLQMDIKIYECY